MGLSVGALWSAGLAPGILVGVLLMVVTYYIARKRNYEKYLEPFRFVTLWRALLGASPALVIPGVIVGGILFRHFQPDRGGVQQPRSSPHSSGSSCIDRFAPPASAQR